MSDSLATPPATAARRISKITIRDFRGFPGNQTFTFNLGPEGKNLLLFGENGTGKSSLYHALRNLLSAIPPDKPFSKYCNVFSPGEEGTIAIEFTSGNPIDYAWNYGEPHPSEDRDIIGFFELARRATFIDYKALLRTSLLHENADHVNLFDLLVNTLLRHVELPDGRTVYNHWIELQNYQSLEPFPAENLEDAEEFDEPETQVNERARHFHDQLNELLNADVIGIVARANSLLQYLESGLTLKLKVDEISALHLSEDPSSKMHEFRGRDIRLVVEYFGYEVEHPAMFLNEGRLTAIALSLYLASAQAVPLGMAAEVPRLLVLDDVLIGLDLSHRIPVLKLLEKEFNDWQVLLMTYDRVWFDIAREYTEHTKRWIYLRLREILQQPGRPSLRVIEEQTNLLDVAERHLNAGDLMASAVYIRAAFESRLRNVCRDCGIKVSFKPDPKEVKADHLWHGIVERQKEREIENKRNFMDPALMSDVEAVHSNILNRLSHSGSPVFVTSEVKFAFETIKGLQNHQFQKT